MSDLQKVVPAFILSVLAFFNSPVYATQWYVSTSGSNSNNGSSTAQAWQGIQFAINSAAVQASDTINIMNGSFAETLHVTKSVRIIGYGGTPTLSAPTSVTNACIVSIEAANVLLQGLQLNVNAPYANAGIVAINRDNLVLQSCTVTRSGSGGSYAVTSSNINQTFTSVGIVFVSDNSAPYETFTLRSTSIGSSNMPFQRAVWLRATSANIGGSSSTDGNNIFGSESDVYLQYSTGTVTLINNNVFGGAGVVIDEPHVFDGSSSSQIAVSANTFNPSAATFSQSLLLRHNYVTNSAVVISSNTFSGHQCGIQSLASANCSITSNVFTPGAQSATHVRLNSACSGVSNNFVRNAATILSNTFQAGSFTDTRAIELLDGNIGTAGQPSPDYIDVTIGSATSPNTFAYGLAKVIRLTSSFNYDVSISQNLFGTNGASASPSTSLTRSQCFELEDKIDHGIDAPGLGVASFLAAKKFVTQNSYISGVTTYPSIQRAINVCAANDSLFIQQGTYSGALSINSAIHIVGDELNAGMPTTIITSTTSPLITKTGASTASVERCELKIGTGLLERWGVIAAVQANSGDVVCNLDLFRRGTEAVGGLTIPGVQGVDVPANIDDGNDAGPGIGKFQCSNILGCPQVYSISTPSATVCESDSLIVMVSGNQTAASYVVVVDGFTVPSTQSLLSNGTRRCAVASLGSGSYQVRVRATVGQCSVWMTGALTITVYTPQVPTLSLNSLNQILCAGSSGQVSVLNSEPQSSYAVFDGANVVSNTLNGTNGVLNFTISSTHFPQSGPKTFSVRATASGNSGCMSETSNGNPDGATFTVYSLPAAPLITTNSPVACAPGGTAMVIVVNAEAGYIYQVLDGNTAVYSVVCTQNGVLSINNIPLSPAVPGLGYGSRTVRVSAINPINNNCRALSANALTISVYQKPATPLIVTGTNIQNYCDPGTGITASVYVANGDPSVQYSVRTADNQTLCTVVGQSGMFSIPVPGLVSSGSPYMLRVVSISNSTSCASDPSSQSIITVNPTPTPIISVEGLNQTGTLQMTLCAGTSQTLNVHSTTNLGTASYQWLRNGVAIQGATQADLTFSPALNVGQYTYTLQQTTAQGCIGTSNAFVLTIAPSATVNISCWGAPASCGFIQGSSNNYVLSSVTEPADLTTSYQWIHDSQNISAATSSTLPVVTSGSVGSHLYQLRVLTGAGCQALSNVITVNVWAVPDFHISVAANGRLDSSYAAVVSPPQLSSILSDAHGLSTSYQWYGPNSSAAISGATSTTFTPPSGLNPGVYRYYARVSLGGVTIGSDTVVLTVLAPASVDIFVLPGASNDSSYFQGVQPPTLGSTITNGNGVIFTYQWFGPNSAGAISGATNPTYTVASTLSPGNYTYTVRISGGSQIAYSDTVHIHVLDAPVLNAYVQPSENQNDSSYFRSLTPPTLGLQLSGNPGYSVSYQWYGPNSVTPITGATTSAYTPPATLSPGTYVYSSRATLGGLTVSSDTVRLTILPDPTVSAYIGSITTTKDSSYMVGVAPPSLASVLSNAAGFTTQYQWVNALSGVIISSATTSTYSVPSNLSVGSYAYVLRVLVGALPLSSDTVHIHVLPAASVHAFVQASGRNDTTYFNGVPAPVLASLISNGGGSTFSYQWYKVGVATPINGATNATFTPSSNLTIGAHAFTVRVESGGFSVSSDTVNVLIVAAPTANAYVHPFTALNDTSTFRSQPPVTVAVVVSSSLNYPISYQWIEAASGTAVSGATTSAYTLQSGLNPGAYTYAVRCSLGGLTIESDTVNVVVLPDPTLSTHILTQTSRKDTTVRAGQYSLTLNSQLSNNAARTPSYQWYNSSTNNAISGATTASMVVPANLSTGNYHYLLRATFPGLTIQSDTVHVHVIPALSVDASIAANGRNDSTYYSGLPAPQLTSTVVNDGGSTVTYQWFGPNSAGAINGATQSSYSPSSGLSPGTHTYYLRVDSDGSSALSDTVTLTVLSPPSANAFIRPWASLNDSTFFQALPAPYLGVRLSATNGYMPTFQWYGPVVGSMITAATDTTYSVPSSLNPGDYSYYCVINIGGINVVSDTVHVHVLPNPTLQAYIQPLQTLKDTSYFQGANPPTLGSTLSNGAGVTAAYQWFDALSGSSISSATSSSYIVPTTLGVGEHRYIVRAILSGLSVWSDTVRIIVLSQPSVTTWINSDQQKTSDTVCAGQGSTTLHSSVVGGTNPLLYQWYVNSLPINGATANTYTLPASLSPGLYGYVLKVTTGGVLVNASSINILVRSTPVPSIQTISGSTQLCSGSQAQLVVGCTQSFAQYQWIDNGSDINGATNQSYSLTASASVGAHELSLRVVDEYGCQGTSSQNSSIHGQVLPSPVPTVNLQSGQLQYCVGNAITAVLNTPTGMNAYQWRKNGTIVTGATQSTITIPSSLGVGTHTYTVDVTDTNGCSGSSADGVSIIVTASPSIVMSGTSQTVCVGYSQTAPLSASVSGCSSTPAYQWTLNGAVIPGATTLQCTVQTGLPVGSYVVGLTVVCGGCETASSTMGFIVQASPAVSISPSDLTVCTGSTTSPTLWAVTSSCPQTAQYQWFKNGAPITGATANSYLLPTASTVGVNAYTVGITCGPCTVTSAPVNVTATLPPQLTTSQSATALCVGYSQGPQLQAQLSTCSATATYQWLLNGASISGATGMNYTVPNGFSPGSYLYRCVASCGWCTIQSDVLTVTVSASPTVSASTSQANLCQGYSSGPTLEAVVTGCNSSSTYQWYHNNTIISGATQATYVVPTGLAPGAMQYSVAVNCNACTVLSTTVTINVQAAPVVSLSSTGQSLCFGYTSVLPITATVSGCTGGVTWHWMLDGQTLNYATSATFNVPLSLSVGTHTIRAVANCGVCTTMSAVYTVTVTDPPQLTLDQYSLFACVGYTTPPTLHASVDVSTPTPSYQWMHAGADIPGATSASYTVPSGMIAGMHTYSVRVTVGNCVLNSATASLTVANPPNVSITATSTSLCAGYSTPVVVNATVSASPFPTSFQWYLNSSPVNGATSSSLIVPTALAAGSYVYQVHVQSGPCTLNSSSVNIVVSNPPTLLVTATQQELCAGYTGSVQLTTTLSGCTSTPSYQWYSASGMIAGASSASYTLPLGLSVGQHSYCVKVQCGACNVLSDSMTIGVRSSPIVTISATTSSLCAEYSTAPILSSTVSQCTGTVYYQWMMNSSPISGATSSSYTIPVGLTSGTYSYSLQAQCGPCVVTTSAVNIVVNAKPTLSLSTLSMTACEGYLSSAPISCAITGCTTAPQYQWFVDNAVVSGATSASFSVPTGLAVGSHSIRVQSVCGPCTVQSETLTFTVQTMPSLTIQCSTQQLCADYSAGPVCSSTMTNATGTVSYQWYIDNTTITGATSSSFTVPTGLSVGVHEVRLRAINGSCTVNSATVQITITVPPTVTLSSTSFSLCEGYSSSASVSCTVSSGSSGAQYQWYVNDTIIAAATSSSYSIPIGLTAGSYSYRVRVSTGPCQVQSGAATLVVVQPPTVTVSTTLSNLCLGYTTSPVLSSTTSNSSASNTFQWYLNSVAVTGATASTYTVPLGLNAGDYTYMLRIQSEPCTVSSSTISIHVVAPPTLTVSSSASSVCATYQSAPVLSSTVVNCVGTPSYEWRMNGALMSGATNSSVSMPLQLSAGSYSFALTVACGACRSTSSATVEVVENPSISIATTSQTLCSAYSSGPNLSSTLQSWSGGVAYQWRKNNVNISGATTSTYTVPTGMSAGTYVYKLEAQCGPCACVSDSLTITVADPPTITVSPAQQSLCGGYAQTTQLNASVSGASGPVNFQWRLNATSISGATGSSYTVPTGLGAGTYNYSVVATCAACSTASNSASVTVTSPHTISISTTTTSMCVGGNTATTITSSLNGCGGTPAFSWTLNGATINGATQSSYTTPSNLAAGTYSYVLIATYGACTASSNTVTITVTTPPTVSVSPAQQTLCQGYSYSQILYSSVIGCSGTPTYQWKKNGVAITGASSASYVIPANMTAGSYNFTVTAGCGGCSVTSAASIVVVVVAPSLTAGIASGPSTLCSGYAAGTTTLQASMPTCALLASYQWTLEGSDISGATSQQYVIPPGLAAGSYHYSCRAVCGPCDVNATNTITINVVPTLNPTITTNATSFCSGSSTPSILSVGGGPYASYQWKLNGSTISGATSSTYTVPSASAPGTYSYSITVTNSGCSATSATTTITVINGAVATVTATSSTVCSGGTCAIIFTLSSGNASSWNLVYAVGAQQYSVNNISGSTYTISVSPVISTTYSVVSVSSGGCTGSGSSAVTVNVQQSPAAQSITSQDGSPQSACNGTSKVFTIASTTSGNTYVWSLFSSQSGVTGTQTSNTSYTVNFAASTSSSYSATIRLTETSPNGCQRINDLTCTVPAAATVITPSVSSGSICLGSATQISLASAQSGVSYRLYQGATQIGSALSAPSAIAWSVTPSSAGQQSYSVLAYTAAGCSTSMGTVTVSVSPAPSVSIAAASTSICPGTAASVSFSFTGQAPWTLVYKIGSGSNTSVTTSTNPYTISPTLSATTSFTIVSVTNSQCSGSISGSSSLTVNMMPMPMQSCVMAFAGDDATVNSNSKVTFWDNYAGSGTSYPDGYVNTSSDATRPQKYANYAALNYHAGIYFDGGDQPVTVAVNTASGISGGAQKSWYMLYRPASSALGTGRMVIYKQGDENHGFCVYLINRVVYYGIWNNQNCTGTCTNKWAVFHNTGFTVVPGNNYILQLVYNGNAAATNRLRFSINGTMYTPSTNPGTGTDYSGDVVSIGGKVGNTRFHDGPSTNDCNQYNLESSKIAEVLLYNSSDASLRANVWCVLKSKYGLSSLGDNPIGVLAKSSEDEEIITGELHTERPRYDLSETRPNPANNYALFSLSVETQQRVHATILNERGQALAVVFSGMVARNTPNGFTIETSTLPSGTYFLRVEGEDFVAHRTFVIVH